MRQVTRGNLHWKGSGSAVRLLSQGQLRLGPRRGLHTEGGLPTELKRGRSEQRPKTAQGSHRQSPRDSQGQARAMNSARASLLASQRRWVPYLISSMWFPHLSTGSDGPSQVTRELHAVISLHLLVGAQGVLPFLPQYLVTGAGCGGAPCGVPRVVCSDCRLLCVWAEHQIISCGMLHHPWVTGTLRKPPAP